MATFTNYTVDPGGLATALLGTTSGIALVGGITLNASADSAVSYYDGSIATLGIGAGLLLTSGYAPGLVNTTQSDGQDNSFSSGFNNGDADIDAVVNTVFNTVSYDATTLEFDFQVTDPSATSITFDIVFGSEEYPEWVDAFVDSAVVIVNGVNYALFNHDPGSPLSVISSNLAAGYFQNNLGNVLGIQYDGVSHVLKIVAPVNGNGAINHIKIGIADTGDHILDSGLFIANLSAGNTPGSGVVSSPGGGSSGNDTLTGSLQGEYFDLLEGDDVAYSGGGDDIVVGGSGDDSVYGGSGDDQLEGDAGSDFLDGGADADTVVYAGTHDQYSISYQGIAGTLVGSSAEGDDTLHNIEYLKFSDGLFALNAGVLTPAGTGTPTPPANTPGVAVIDGIVAVGSTLTAVVSDADGIPGSIAYQWFADNVAIGGATGASFTVTAAEAGSVISFSASYTDGNLNVEELDSAGIGALGLDDGDIAIETIHITAPAGATVMNPLTTVMAALVQAGASPNEAGMMVKAVLGIDAAVDLRTYDSWSALNANEADPTALAVQRIALQVAILTSAAGDQDGTALAQRVALAHANGQTIDLADLAFIQAFVGPADPNRITDEIFDRNNNVAVADRIQEFDRQWVQFQGGHDQLVLTPISALSVHINQAPTGTASASFETAQGVALTITQAQLTAGLVDPEGGALSVTGLTADQGGTITANGDGSWTITPAPGFVGPIELGYTIQDAQGLGVSAVVMFVVSPPATAVDQEAIGALSVGGLAAEGETLFAALSASDADGAIQTAYQWQELVGGNWVAIAGANASAFAIASDQSDVGRVVRVVATTTDALGGTTVFTGDALTIANVNDAHTGTVSVQGTAQEGSTLTAVAALADEDGLGVLNYEWRVAGESTVLQSGAGNTLLLTAAMVGQSITVTASYTDGGGSAEAETSAATASVSATPGLLLNGTTLADLLAGGNGADTLRGQSGTDTLQGAGGNDLLEGGAGNDTLGAGDGDDTIRVAAGGGIDAIDGGLGNDRIEATGGNLQIGLSSVGGIETISAGGFANVGILGSSLGEVLDFGATNLVGIVQIDGGSGNDTLVGSSAADVLYGNGGTDSIAAGGGDDTIRFGAGTADAIDGGTGFNTLRAAGNNASVVWSTVSNVQAVSGGAFSGVAIAGNSSAELIDVSGIALENIARIDGGSGNDTLRGTAAADVLVGGSGNDRIEAGDGDDVLRVTGSGGTDSVDGGLGIDRIEAGAANSRIGLATFAGIEVISGNGFAGVSVLGGSTADSLDFSAVTLDGIALVDASGGNDLLTGSAGNDVLSGGSGLDTVNGGGGDDTIQFGTSTTDLIDGGSGFNTLVASANNASIRWGGVSNVQAVNGGAFTGVAIAGGSSAEVIDLHAVALSGIARIDGGSGNDTVTGSAGDDVIVGGLGRDVLLGGAGADRFVFTRTSDSANGANADRVGDFTAGSDLFDFQQIDASTLVAGDQAFSYIGSDAFSHVAGELRAETAADGIVHVYGDVNGDGLADFDIQAVLMSPSMLVASDFVL